LYDEQKAQAIKLRKLHHEARVQLFEEQHQAMKNLISTQKEEANEFLKIYLPKLKGPDAAKCKESVGEFDTILNNLEQTYVLRQSELNARLQHDFEVLEEDQTKARLSDRLRELENELNTIKSVITFELQFSRTESGRKLSPRGKPNDMSPRGKDPSKRKSVDPPSPRKEPQAPPPPVELLQSIKEFDQSTLRQRKTNDSSRALLARNDINTSISGFQRVAKLKKTVTNDKSIPKFNDSKQQISPRSPR
jgi:hypothetical protein